MSGSLDALTAERDRVESELDKLEQEHKDLQQKSEALAERRATAQKAGDDLAKLDVEAEQLAEAKRKNDRLLHQTKKRFNDIEEEVAMLQQSSIV